MMGNDENKKVVLEFLRQVFEERNPGEASKYLDPSYTQHNPTAGDGIDGFLAMITPLLDVAPDVTSSVKRVVIEDDLVVVHHHLKMFESDNGQAVMDIFRVHDSRIAEHWDVVQPVPAEPANSNTMF